MVRVLIFAALLIASVVSFSIPSNQRTRSSSATALSAIIEDEDDKLIGKDDFEYTGNVDWDNEWKKVVRNEGQPAERPGKGYYKTDAEIFVTKNVNKATEKIVETTSQIRVPSFQSLSGDWRFWVGILAVVSVLSSVIAGAGQVQAPMMQQDSYYI
eukprot:CAMPEP_0202454300 /NCGR_PEP_ID=MMETSP1360-20130828/12077_1 /ASSEMBLY_ACC=CAM_ASM_000848 /TAXON_ID=515479 /ORGANISM="Licmophora paradoxa, Strain CCMP2313" /LENGTH=155 /DNA_ID=CAMNT_0049073593 /DNA_START=46 /DNA_END=513 /DNA_ORIENTATION=-